MATKTEVQLATTIASQTSDAANTATANAEHKSIKAKRWWNFGHIMWWVTFGWALYDFITNYWSVMSLRLLGDVCPQFECRMIGDIDGTVNAYYGCFCFGFAVDMFMHLWEGTFTVHTQTNTLMHTQLIGVDLCKVYKNPSYEGTKLDFKQTRRMMYVGWVAVVFCDWTTIIVTITLYFNPVQDFVKINRIFLRSLLISNISLFISGIRALGDRVAYLELVQDDANSVPFCQRLQNAVYAQKFNSVTLEKGGEFGGQYRNACATPSCCHCCWVVFMLCFGFMFGGIAFIAVCMYVYASRVSIVIISCIHV